MKRALYQKNSIVTDRADMIFEVTKFSVMPIFRGSAPEPTGGAYWESLYIAALNLLAGDEWTRFPIRNNPTPVLGPSIRPRFNGSQGLTHYRVVNRKYYTVNTQ